MGRAFWARGVWWAWTTIAALVLSTSASAFDFFDGRLQVHGFYEAQIRVMARDFQLDDDLDLTQWYNVLNLEIEADVAPDGFGPFDLVSFFSRIEVRYDCVWRRACGLFSSADAYGDRAKRLPKRLSDGRRSGYDGTQFTGDVRRYSGVLRQFLPYEFGVPPLGVGNGQHVPGQLFNVAGFTTLSSGLGIDGVAGVNPVTGINDDPGDIVFSNFTKAGVNPFDFSATDGGTTRAIDHGDRCTFGFRSIRGPADGSGSETLPHDPNCPIIPLAINADKPNPLRGATLFNLLGNPLTAVNSGILGAGGATLTRADGGDRNPILQFDASGALIPAASQVGSGELPLRRAPLSGNTTPSSKGVIQGIYLPNKETLRMAREGKFDSFDQNFRQSELEWNRGASQQDEKELKEAYFDLEMFDSQLWLRAGKQSIVWGKTELFRTTDQFNPQDLALSSLPSLEESRIGLWALRGVWSFYDVGPINDVRLELAANLDQFEPADLGRCGEPYTPLAACAKTFGLMAHGLAGIGIAGEVRPPNFWNSWKGVEVGGRLEWRWDRFSFALTNFYGFNDFPYQDRIFSYSRNVDPITGRPRRAESTGRCLTGAEEACLTASNSLEEHSVNQQVFHMICGSSIGFTGLDPGACGQTVFNSQVSVAGLPIADILSRIIAGQTGGAGAGDSLFDLLIGSLGTGLPASYLPAVAAQHVLGFDTPLVPLIKDNGIVDRLDDPFLVDPGASNQGLMRHLTVQQEALLGCGQFYGTDCDEHGIDLMNTEASALMQSFPNFEGTFGTFWDTTASGVAQPGTVGFAGGPVCTRYEGGRTYILPGCRGENGPLLPDDPGYDSTIDGSTGDQVHPFAGRGPDGILGTADDQYWKSEMAILSWNALMGLVGFSVSADAEIRVDEFDPANPFRDDGCSYKRPQNCSALTAIIALIPVQRSSVRAGGNGDYGRRDFVWSQGGDIALRYEKRNVLGFSMDFAEDLTKSNWGVETTWIEGLPFTDNDEFDGVTTADTYNLTVSVDRPTFINFLNANRTFFFNSQWFFQYTKNHKRGFTSNGPYNVLGTFTVTTGYFQDRLLPGMTFVYDFKSNSGAVLPQFTYRFTENFSATFGLALFMGRSDPKRAPINPLSAGNNVGRHKDSAFVENGLSLVRERDEAFLRVRYAF